MGAGLWVLLLGGLVASIAGTATLHFACAVRVHPYCMCIACTLPPPHRLHPRATALLPHRLRTAPTAASASATASAATAAPQVGGAALFSLYIVYDVSMISKRTSPDDYIPAAIELYLDIANLFLHILRILAHFQENR